MILSRDPAPAPDLADLPALSAALGLTVGAPATWSRTAALDVAWLQAELWSHGYFVDAPVIPPALVARCTAAIELVIAAGAAPLAGFAFDAPWELQALLADHAAAALGEAAVLLPAFWAWRLTATTPRGWGPHRDRPDRLLDARGAPSAISLWTALTDATTDNGCIHVVPAELDLHYGVPDAPPEVPFVQAVRALPAPAGAVLGWTSALVHWGGIARADRPGRTSLAFEYQRAAAPPSAEVCYPRGWFPSPAERRVLIAAQLAQYDHMHDLSAATCARTMVVVDAITGG